MSVRPVLALLHEFMGLTADRIETAWTCADVLCEQYAQEGDLSTYARRENFRRNLEQLSALVERSTSSLHDRQLALESVDEDDMSKQPHLNRIS